MGIYRRRKLPVETLVVDNPQEIRGINSRTELAEVSRLVRQKKNEELMAAGVTLVDPATTYIDPRRGDRCRHRHPPGRGHRGADAHRRACEIQAHVRIADSEIGDHVTINNFCLIVGARVADGAAVGPFAHLRPESAVGERRKIGNFVELKKTTLGAGSKANHLAYLGDATIGADVNIGAGTITCNYDGEKKHQTVIEDGAFIGSDTQLIAPVRVGKGAYVGRRVVDHARTCPAARSASRAAGSATSKAGWSARRPSTRKKVERVDSEPGERETRMCGIIGYIGSKPVVPVLLDGLRRMEYRGYDSAGVALVEP